MIFIRGVGGRQEELRHIAVTIELFTFPQYKSPPPPPLGNLQVMTNHLHTTIRKIHFWLFGWVFNGTQVSIKYFRESINSKKEISQKIAIKSETF